MHIKVPPFPFEVLCFLQRNVTKQVRTVKLADDLHQTKRYRGSVLGKRVVLTLGFRQIEFDRVNCGIFMYWHKRLIKAYERVGRMLHSADYGRGVIGVIDITELMVRVPTFWQNSAVENEESLVLVPHYLTFISTCLMC